MGRTRTIAVALLAAWTVVATAHAGDFASPAGFIANRGQWDQSALFIGHVAGIGLRAEPEAIALHATGIDPQGEERGVVVRLSFSSAERSTREAPRGVRLLAGVHNFFLGDDPDRWASRVPWFEEVLYRSVAPGVDLRLHTRSSRLTFDLELKPGADLRNFGLRCEGAERVEIASDGTLVLHTAAGVLKQHPARAYRVDAFGDREPVPCRVVVHGDTFGFELPATDGAVVVDPGLEWSTFLGGVVKAPAQFPDGNLLSDIAWMSDRRPVVTGLTGRIDFPTTTGSYAPQYQGGNKDAFITCFDPRGTTLVFSTYLGGSQTDAATAVVTTSSDAIVVAGRALSVDFPTTAGSYSTGSTGLMGLFITRLDSTGSSPEYSSAIRVATQPVDVWNMALASDEDPIVVGGTSATDFPTTPGAFQPVSDGHAAFVLRMESNGSALVFSTLLGGSSSDRLFDVDVGPHDVVVVAQRLRIFRRRPVLSALSNRVRGTLSSPCSSPTDRTSSMRRT